jgi:acid-sensing ion channel, other
MQYEVPRFTTGFLTIDMEKSITVRIDPQMMTTSEALRDYSADERKCYFSDERRLKYFEKYTQPNCETECEVDNVLEKCGCLFMFIEGTIIIYSFVELKFKKPSIVRRDVDTCGPYHESCMIYYTDEIKDPNFLGCNCLPACASLTFESQVFENDLNMTDLGRTHNVDQKKSLSTHIVLKSLP